MIKTEIENEARRLAEDKLFLILLPKDIGEELVKSLILRMPL